MGMQAETQPDSKGDGQGGATAAEIPPEQLGHKPIPTELPYRCP